MDLPDSKMMPYVLHYIECNAKFGSISTKKTLEVVAIVSIDGANSCIVKCISTCYYEYAIAFQEWVKILDDKMKYYKNLAVALFCLVYHVIL